MYQFSDKYTKWISCFLFNRKQRVMVNEQPSQWAPVTSGIPQGSVLGPMLFVLYINDLPEQLPNNSSLYLYADDTKIYREINDPEDQEKLQEDIYHMYSWSDKWLLKFHPDKCHTMSIGKNKDANREYKLDTDIPPMKRSSCEKDVGVVVDDRLTFGKHITEKVNKANSILGVMSRSFEYLDNQTFKLIYTGLVRPHIEYANSVWRPYKKKDIQIIENVQRRATRLVPGLAEMSYPDRLRALKLPTLAYRRIRGDMIEVFKIMKDHYYFDKHQLFKQREGNTRGHQYKLYKERPRLDVRKYSFTHRVVDHWNSLPESVISAHSVHSFEKRLDKFWSETELIYNYEAQIATGHKLNKEELELEADDSLLPEVNLW